MSKPIIIMLFAPALVLGVIFTYLAIRQRAQVAIWLLASAFTAAVFAALHAWNAPAPTRGSLITWALFGAVMGTLIYLKHSQRWAYWDKQRRVSDDRVRGVSPLTRITDGV